MNQTYAPPADCSPNEFASWLDNCEIEEVIPYLTEASCTKLNDFRVSFRKSYRHKRSIAFLNAIDLGAALIPYMLSSLVGILVFPYLSFLILIGAFSFLALSAIGFLAPGAYKQIVYDAEKMCDEIIKQQIRNEFLREKLAQLKKTAKEVDIDFIDHKKLHLPLNDQQRLLVKGLHETKKKKPKILSFMESINTTLLVSTIIVESIHVPITMTAQILGVTALTAFLSSPAGIGLILGATFLVAAFFGYKKYQFNKQAKSINKQTKQLKKDFLQSLNEYQQLSKFNRQNDKAEGNKLSKLNEKDDLVVRQDKKLNAAHNFKQPHQNKSNFWKSKLIFFYGPRPITYRRHNNNLTLATRSRFRKR